MIIGYCIIGHDNCGRFFENAPEDILCPICGSCLDWNYYPKSIIFDASKKYDVSATYDGRQLFSARFIEYSANEGLVNKSNFHLVSKKPEYFYFLPTEKVSFDPVNSKTYFSEKCLKCGNFRAVAGAIPGYTKLKVLPHRGFFRTDLTFGDGSEKFPLIIVDPETKEGLASQKFRGLEFHEFRSSIS